jgi:integrase
MSIEDISRPVYALSTQRIERFQNTSSKDQFIRDPHLRGFGVRITPRNTKSFIVETREKTTGKVRRIVVGHYPLMTLQEARRKALDALRELKYSEITSDKPISLRTLVEAFLKSKAHTLRERSLEDYRMIFYSPKRGEENGHKRGCFPAWMDQSVTFITGRGIIDRYLALCEERGVGTANKAMRVLHGALNYGRAIYPVLQDWTNPVSVLTATRCRRALKPRTRYIPLAKLGDWLQAVDAEDDPDMRLLFKLLIMTGLRSKEARSLTWTQVDLEQGSITITDEQAKNHQAVTLPLNSWLRTELTKKQKPGSVYVFENGKVTDGYVRNLRRPIERIAKRSGLEFTPHDLRRSFATYLDTVGTPFGVIKQLLNHKSKADVTERYIQQRGLQELAKYSDEVLSLLIDAAPETCIWHSSCGP